MVKMIHLIQKSWSEAKYGFMINLLKDGLAALDSANDHLKKVFSSHPLYSLLVSVALRVELDHCMLKNKFPRL